MPGLHPLQSLYKQQAEESPLYFERVVAHFFQFSQHSLSQDIVEECVWRGSACAEEGIAENWKHLLSVNLLCHLAHLPSALMAEKVRQFECRPWNQSSQYIRALVALNHFFAGMPVPEVGPHLLESGAALIELKEYSPWLSLPFTPHHFEFGIYLCFLALMTQRQDLREAALRLARWQLNTLDALGLPLAGLFVREQDGHLLHRLCASYLLFRGAAILGEESLFDAAADAAIRGIERCIGFGSTILPLWPLIEHYFEPCKNPYTGRISLPESVYDPSTALVGHRTSAQHVFCTLHGGYTGLGEIRLGDVEMLSYGPQHLPLEECRGFGIEGNMLSDHGVRRSIIVERRPHSFSLRGCTRLVDPPSSSLPESKGFRGIWMEVLQEFKKPHFSLQIHLLGLDGWDEVAFSFFIQADRCRLVDHMCLQAGMLEGYEGEVQPLLFEGQESCLELRSLSFEGRMKVIPLAGGANFWGASFLAAYFLHSEERHYHWQVGPPLKTC